MLQQQAVNETGVATAENPIQTESEQSKPKRGGRRPGAARKPNYANRLLSARLYDICGQVEPGRGLLYTAGGRLGDKRLGLPRKSSRDVAGDLQRDKTEIDCPGATDRESISAR
jgi:hypothetical protein